MQQELIQLLHLLKTENQGDSKSFVVADLPGLIKGASLGEGLGDKFLKHIERTRIIAHVIDMSGFEGRNPYEDYLLINKELEDFNKSLLLKPQIIIANKMDIPTSTENLKEFRKKVKNVEIFEVSAMNNQGMKEVLIKLSKMLDTIEKKPLYEEEKFESHILYKFKKEQPFSITKDGNVWVVSGKEVEKLLRMTRFTTDEAAKRFANKLRRMGIDEKLKEMGAVDGDYVRILDLEFEFSEN